MLFSCLYENHYRKWQTVSMAGKPESVARDYPFLSLKRSPHFELFLCSGVSSTAGAGVRSGSCSGTGVWVGSGVSSGAAV